MENLTPTPAGNRGSKYEIQQSQNTTQPIEYQRIITVLENDVARQLKLIERLKAVRYG